MLSGLRTAEGISIAKLKSVIPEADALEQHVSFKQIEELRNEGFIEADAKSVRLSQKGRNVLDSIVDLLV